MGIVEETLQELGPCISTELVRALATRYGLSPVAARQRVSRAATIKRLAYLPFARNARFVYFEKDFGSDEFWSKLGNALLSESKIYGAALFALRARQGLIPQRHFSIACGAPLRQKGHVSPAMVADRLLRSKLMSQVEVSGLGPCYTLSESPSKLESSGTMARARLLAESILLQAIKTWLKNLAIASFEKVAVRDDNAADQPRVGTFHWDLTGPSYLSALTNQVGGVLKPGFIACDILLGSAVGIEDVTPFLLKGRTLRALPKVGRCLQIFVAERYSREAYRALRTAGVLPATAKNLFGEEVSTGLAELIKTLQATANFATSAEKIDLIFRKLSKIEGAAINLRGALFEFLVGDILRSLGASQILRNRRYRLADGTACEADVIAHFGERELRFVECRGYQPHGLLDEADVRKWLEQKVPRLREAALANPEWRNRELIFEIWTTGDFTAAARAYLDEAHGRTRKYKIQYRTADEVLEAANETRNTALIATLSQHFLRHPLAQLQLPNPTKPVTSAPALLLASPVAMDSLLDLEPESS